MADNVKLNREAYAEVYVGAGDPHYVLADKTYGADMASQIGSRNTRGVQAIPAYDKEGKSKHYLIADNIMYFTVFNELSEGAIDALVSMALD